jgi:hypothetical protein
LPHIKDVNILNGSHYYLFTVTMTGNVEKVSVQAGLEIFEIVDLHWVMKGCHLHSAKRKWVAMFI